MASDFVLRASNLEGIAEKVYGVSKSFDGHNQRITNAISRLNTQRSDGISKIVFALQGIQRDLRWGNRNLSNEVLQLKNFLRDVLKLSEEAENNAYRILAGASPEEIKRLANILDKIPPAVLAAIMNGSLLQHFGNSLYAALWQTLKNDKGIQSMFGENQYSLAAGLFTLSQLFSGVLSGSLGATGHTVAASWVKMFSDDFSTQILQVVKAFPENNPTLSLSNLPWVGYVIAAGLSIYDVKTEKSTIGEGTFDFIANVVTLTAGSLTVAWVGAKVGGTVGSAAGPVGTVVGAIAGFAVTFVGNLLIEHTPAGKKVKEVVVNAIDTGVDWVKEQTFETITNGATNILGNVRNAVGRAHTNLWFGKILKISDPGMEIMLGKYA